MLQVAIEQQAEELTVVKSNLSQVLKELAASRRRQALQVAMLKSVMGIVQKHLGVQIDGILTM